MAVGSVVKEGQGWLLFTGDRLAKYWIGIVQGAWCLWFVDDAPPLADELN